MSRGSRAAGTWTPFCGVDINPFAVAISRFRLLLAAMDAVGATALERAPGFSIHVLTGDSLYFSHDQDHLPGFRDDFAYAGEDKDALIKALVRGQYDAVVANPPYIEGGRQETQPVVSK